MEANALTQEQNYYDIGNHVVTPPNVPAYINDKGTNNVATFGTAGTPLPGLQPAMMN